MVENLEEINSVCSWEIIQSPTHKLEVTLFLISVYARAIKEKRTFFETFFFYFVAI